jgi:hypothetical protein
MYPKALPDCLGLAEWFIVGFVYCQMRSSFGLSARSLFYSCPLPLFAFSLGPFFCGPLFLAFDGKGLVLLAHGMSVKYQSCKAQLLTICTYLL